MEGPIRTQGPSSSPGPSNSLEPPSSSCSSRWTILKQRADRLGLLQLGEVCLEDIDVPTALPDADADDLVVRLVNKLWSGDQEPPSSLQRYKCSKTELAVKDLPLRVLLYRAFQASPSHKDVRDKAARGEFSGVRLERSRKPGGPSVVKALNSSGRWRPVKGTLRMAALLHDQEIFKRDGLRGKFNFPEVVEAQLAEPHGAAAPSHSGTSTEGGGPQPRTLPPLISSQMIQGRAVRFWSDPRQPGAAHGRSASCRRSIDGTSSSGDSDRPDGTIRARQGTGLSASQRHREYQPLLAVLEDNFMRAEPGTCENKGTPDREDSPDEAVLPAALDPYGANAQLTRFRPEPRPHKRTRNQSSASTCAARTEGRCKETSVLGGPAKRHTSPETYSVAQGRGRRTCTSMASPPKRPCTGTTRPPQRHVQTCAHMHAGLPQVLLRRSLYRGTVAFKRFRVSLENPHLSIKTQRPRRRPQRAQRPERHRQAAHTAEAPSPQREAPEQPALTGDGQLPHQMKSPTAPRHSPPRLRRNRQRLRRSDAPMADGDNTNSIQPLLQPELQPPSSTPQTPEPRNEPRASPPPEPLGEPPRPPSSTQDSLQPQTGPQAPPPPAPPGEPPRPPLPPEAHSSRSSPEPLQPPPSSPPASPLELFPTAPPPRPAGTAVETRQSQPLCSAPGAHADALPLPLPQPLLLQSDKPQHTQLVQQPLGIPQPLPLPLQALRSALMPPFPCHWPSHLPAADLCSGNGTLTTAGMEPPLFLPDPIHGLTEPTSPTCMPNANACGPDSGPPRTSFPSAPPPSHSAPRNSVDHRDGQPMPSAPPAADQNRGSGAAALVTSAHMSQQVQQAQDLQPPHPSEQAQPVQHPQHHTDQLQTEPRGPPLPTRQVPQHMHGADKRAPRAARRAVAVFIAACLTTCKSHPSSSKPDGARCASAAFIADCMHELHALLPATHACNSSMGSVRAARQRVPCAAAADGEDGMNTVHGTSQATCMDSADLPNLNPAALGILLTSLQDLLQAEPAAVAAVMAVAAEAASGGSFDGAPAATAHAHPTPAEPPCSRGPCLVHASMQDASGEAARATGEECGWKAVGSMLCALGAAARVPEARSLLLLWVKCVEHRLRGGTGGVGAARDAGQRSPSAGGFPFDRRLVDEVGALVRQGDVARVHSLIACHALEELVAVLDHETMVPLEAALDGVFG